MALAIRLARGGAKKRPFYRIVVTDARNARDGKFLEKLGTYNPLLNKENPERIKLDTERAAHWLSVGAQPSDRVARFLDAAGVRPRVASNNPVKGQPGEKAKERLELKAMKEAEAAEAKAAAEAAAAEAAAAPVPEPEVEAEAAPEAAADLADAEVAAEEAAPVAATDADAAADAATGEEPVA